MILPPQSQGNADGRGNHPAQAKTVKRNFGRQAGQPGYDQAFQIQSIDNADHAGKQDGRRVDPGKAADPFLQKS